MPETAPNSGHKTARRTTSTRLRSTAEKQLKESGEKQISISDPESRQIMLRNNITEVAYNIQSTVDSKHNIPIDFKVTNENDSKAMGNMVQRAKSILRTNEFTVLYDKGFHTGSELKTAQQLGVETIVAIPGVPSTSQSPNPLFNYEFFKYNREDDTYTCPGGPYGTIKRQWGFSYVLTKKGICRAGSDVGFMFIAYNLRRIGNILTMNVLKEYLRILVSLFLTVLDFFRRKISRLWTPFFRELICSNEKQLSLKSL